ncbi:hypothetical protein Pmani_039489 [Petrolisthes manimaculis]|uniref:Uncharacterized protein n=1 Tax=Petrolisthes manimaculis TaxID=1843537 RepID=A0AAE1NCR7_9EUCA|nr:hypothetical protein Pmani_039489 [Petrolisthes manimaculis]
MKTPSQEEEDGGGEGGGGGVDGGGRRHEGRPWWRWARVEGGGMESCVSQQHYVTPGATSLPMGEYVQMAPDMGPHPCNPAMTSYLDSLPPGVGMPEYPWMKEKKTVRKPPQQGESSTRAWWGALVVVGTRRPLPVLPLYSRCVR